MNQIKKTQLFIHHHYEAIKLMLLLAIILMLSAFSVAAITNQNRIIQQVKKLGEQNKTLNQQTKKIAEDNQYISKQNRSYTRCIATIFAQYTHDFIPVTILNLDKCTLDSHSAFTQNSGVQGTSETKSSAPATSSPQPSSKSSSSSPKHTPPKQPGSTNNPQPDCTIDLLGVHLFC